MSKNATNELTQYKASFLAEMDDQREQRMKTWYTACSLPVPYKSNQHNWKHSG